MLLDDLKRDSLAARKDGRSLVSRLLITVIGEIETQTKRDGKEATDQLVIATCKKFVANNLETIGLTKKHESGLLSENQILENYLPQQLTETELRVIIRDLGAENIGAVMGHLKSNYAGRYDGKSASGIAREYLAVKD